MKKTILAVGLAVGFAAPALAGDPVEGIWKTEVDDGSYAYIDMGPCASDASKICGIIARTFKSDGEYESENKGKMLVINMEPQGGGLYKGKVWRPSNDKIYIGKMEMDGNNKLALSGCVLGGLICAAQNWTRVQ